ncbi:MAG: polysaccharide pyruvyl transferase CsaB, partial [Clostridia bacterium]|nr:polysaccharide pyruvyl transferase CsaB [Clostridia bacterium]
PAMPVTVMTRDPEKTSKRFGVGAIHTLNIFGFMRAARSTALYINGGGSLIQDVTSRRSLWYYLFTIRAAGKRGCRVMMYGCGIGPVMYKRDIHLTRRVLNRYVDSITLREPDSLAELRRFGVDKPEIVLSSDPAITLGSAPDGEVDAVLSENGADPRGKYICFALRRWPGFTEKAPAFSAAARYSYEKYGLTPLFLSINHHNDSDAAGKVIEDLRETPYHSLPGPLPPALAIGVMARMEIVVSMRLHGLIFAAGHGVPLVGVSYDPKVTAFLRCVESGCTELSEVTPERLCTLIDAAAALRGDRQRLMENAKRLLGMESKNIETAGKLLGKDVSSL